MRDKLKIIAVDVDGTLTAGGDAWDEEACLSAAPNPVMVEWVNKMYITNWIVIYTARKDHLIPATLKWLRKNGIPFHAISNNKMSADIYVDDRMIPLPE